VTGPASNVAVGCADAALAAGIDLAGTASRAERWLLVEHPARWGRDPLMDTPFPDGVADRLQAFDGRVLLLRRPGTSAARAPAVYRADAAESGGTLLRLPLEDVRDLATADLERGEACDAPLLIVCAHGRRDRCCARLGPPVFDALRAHDAGAVWESSHQGGHRFAANVLVLPWGVQLGRVTPGDAGRVLRAVRERRIPFDLFRGRTIHEPRVQAAEAAVRRALGLERVDAVGMVADDGDRVRLSVPDGEAVVVVEEVAGPALPASCGGEPAPATSLVARVESLA
jgi:hypothetical protein